jgi:hypothetical protein
MVESTGPHSIRCGGDFMKTRLRQVQISEALCVAAEKCFAGEFSGIEDLLEFVLRKLLNEHCVPLDRAEQQAVEDRLRELGYI